MEDSTLRGHRGIGGGDQGTGVPSHDHEPVRHPSLWDRGSRIGAAAMSMMPGRDGFLPFFSFVVVALAWEALVFAEVWDPSVLPGPRQVAASTLDLLKSGSLFEHSVASLFRVTAGYYLAILVGIPLGVLFGTWVDGRRVFNSFIQFLRPISPLAWIPLAMLWFGIGEKPAVFLIFLSAVFPILVPVMDAVNQINPTYFRVASNFGLNRREVVLDVILPAVLPRVLPALRISLGVAWMVVVAAEMIAVKSGLGFLILDSRNALRMDYVISAMLTIGVIGVVLDQIMLRFMRLPSVSWAR
jgi:NitT/TauT family transport system permease protein